MKDFIRAVQFRIAGLPTAARMVFGSADCRPEVVIRRAYARHFWRPGSVSELAALAIALIAWPVTLAGSLAVYSLKNGSTAARRSDRSVASQTLDQVRLYFTCGVLPRWYYIFELHDSPTTSHARAFLSRAETKGGVFHLLKEGPFKPSSAVTNKADFYDRCREHGITTPPVLAVIAADESRQPPKLADLDTDLFVKPLRGRGGKGAERWDFKAGLYCNTTGTGLRSDELLKRLEARASSEPLVIQPRLHNHPELESLSNGALSTVRVLTCLNELNVPELVGAVFRMAIGSNHTVDNLHAGGIAAAVNLETGILGRASNLGADNRLGWVDRHPDTGALVTGTTLPLWPDVRQFAFQAHSAFADRIIVGWDIAITPAGPMLVEANGGPDLDIMQRFGRLGSGRARLGTLLAFHLSRLQPCDRRLGEARRLPYAKVHEPEGKDKAGGWDGRGRRGRAAGAGHGSQPDRRGRGRERASSATTDAAQLAAFEIMTAIGRKATSSSPVPASRSGSDGYRSPLGPVGLILSREGA